MQTVQGSKDCWNWAVVREFSDQKDGNTKEHSASKQIREALEHDPDGLAITTAAQADSRVKPLAVAGMGKAVSLNALTVSDGAYPFTRSVYFYVHKPQHGKIDPLLVDFLRFVLSPQGQTIVKHTGDFLPLSPEAADAEAEKLR